MRMVKTRRGWRYEPRGSTLRTVALRPRNPKCP
jgi:hypothetical protein